jgi:hypothetical protein
VPLFKATRFPCSEFEFEALSESSRGDAFVLGIIRKSKFQSLAKQKSSIFQNGVIIK